MSESTLKMTRPVFLSSAQLIGLLQTGLLEPSLGLAAFLETLSAGNIQLLVLLFCQTLNLEEVYLLIGKGRQSVT